MSRCLLALTVWLLGIPALAHAQPAPPGAPGPEKPWAVGVPADRRFEALELYRKGNAFFEQRQYSLALAEYEVAITRWNHPAIRYNMAVALINLDRTLEAFESLEQSLRFGAEPLGQHYAQALTYQRLLLGRLARIRVVCPVPGARVTLDGQPLFTGPGEATRLTVTGRHLVVASLDGHLTDTRPVVVAPGEVTTITVRPLRIVPGVRYQRRFKRVWMPWAVLSGGVVVAAAGGALLARASSGYAAYNRGFAEECPSGCQEKEVPSSLVTLRDQARASRAWGFGLVGVGAAIALAGTILAILNTPMPVRESHPEAVTGAPRLRFDPSVLPGGFSLSVDGRF
jgi:hypothetical protein